MPRTEAFFDASAARLSSHSPDVLAVTCMSSSIPFALEIARKYRMAHSRSRIFLGGPQATLLHEKILERFPFIDGVCRGEGEATLAALLEAGADPSGITGVSWRDDGGRIHVNPDRPLIEDLDELPEWDYGVLDLAARRAARGSGFSLPVETGRGCPYGCSYCASQLVWKRRFRLKSVRRILSEIGRIVRRTGIRRFHFLHDLFSLNARWVAELCAGLSEVDGGPVAWACDTRTDAVTPDLLEKMARSGCYAVFFGLETGSAAMQRRMNKRVDLASALESIRMAAAVGIRPSVAFILGHPGETEKTLNDSFDFMMLITYLGLPVEIAVNLFTPEYGTPAYHACRDSLRPAAYTMEKDLAFQTPHIRRLIASDPEIFSHFYYPEGGYPHDRLVRMTALLPLMLAIDDISQVLKAGVKGCELLSALHDAMGPSPLFPSMEAMRDRRLRTALSDFSARMLKTHGLRIAIDPARVRGIQADGRFHG